MEQPSCRDARGESAGRGAWYPVLAAETNWLVWQEMAVTGTYGIGMGVDVPVGKTKVEKPFAVSKVTSLKDPMGNGCRP
eukprot:3767097-Rhodomonas_salina.2